MSSLHWLLQIYKDGQLHGYIDGSQSCSWMKFIQCARNKQEQNLYAFQYREKIYYRAYKTIYPGQELLVWYDDLYTQYLGIPYYGIYDMAAVNGQSYTPSCIYIVVMANYTYSLLTTGHVVLIHRYN